MTASLTRPWSSPSGSAEQPVLRSRSVRRRVFRELTKNANLVGLIVLLLFVALAIFPDQLRLRDPGRTDVSHAMTPPLPQCPFGTDRLGRDVYSRVISATRVSLALPFLSVVSALLLGVSFGLVSGYLGGWWDVIISRLMDIIFGLPILLFAIVVIAFLGASVTNAILAMIVIFTPLLARLTQASVLAEKNKEYITASIAVGARKIRTVVRHILPNIVSPILVQATMQMAAAILIEASISFLGLGTTAENPSWGRMLYDSYPLLELAPWASIFPGLAVVLSVISFNLIGDALRDVLDPRLI